MKRRIRRWITGIMTASILSQFLNGTVSMAADREAESVSADSAVVLEDNISDGEEISTDNEETDIVSDNSGSSDQDSDSGMDEDAVSSNSGNGAVTASTEESLGDVSDDETGETVSGDNAGEVELTDTEESDDRLDEVVDNAAERGVLESELSSEPYIFNYDSFSVEWRVVSHWEGACNVSVNLHNRSDETIHNWNLSFMSEDEIINPYNAKITSEGSNGNKWTLKNLEYNQDIRPGESIQFGFQVKYGERVDIPFSYSIYSSEKNVAGDSYEITNNIISSWDGGSVGEIRIANNTDTAIEDWTVTVRTKAVLVNVWGGTVEKVSDNTYELKCPDYAQNIASGQTAVIGYQVSDSDTDIEILGLNEWTSSANKIDTNEESSVSDNSVSGNTVSDNTVSDNSISDNSVSENKPVYIESDGHQHIFIDSEEYELLDEGIYLLDVYSDSVTGYIDHEDEIESVDFEIKDVFEETVWEGELISADGFNTWSIDDTGFVLGANKLIFEVTFTNGTVMKEELIVINREASNIDNTYIELVDEDGDNIYDYYEKYFGTDPDKKDTDGDGLDDGAELFILDTDPIDDDTDDDGIRDCDEDEDSDGLNVLQEYELGTYDLVDDYDLDGLSDGYEANVSGTDPTLADTDFDGLLDKEELDLGLDPLDTDSDDDGILDGDETIMREETKEYTGEAVNRVGVNISCSGSMEDKIYISKANDKSGILNDTAGLIGDFYDIECDAEFETAEIVFNYDESMLGDTDESDLRLIWYNEETREFVLLEDSIVDTENNTISYTTTHFSPWGAVDSKVFKDAFDTPASSGTNNKYIGNNKFKYIHDWYIISLDFTASPDDIEKQLQITQAIIDQMDGYDILYITCYGSDNTLTQPYYIGDLDRWPGGNWPVDGKFELKKDCGAWEMFDYYNNPVFGSDGYSYSGDFARELIRIAMGNEYAQTNKDDATAYLPSIRNVKAYIFYQGSQYDDNISKYLDSPVQDIYHTYDMSVREGINLAADRDYVINTVSLAAPFSEESEYMNDLIPVTGGRSYSDAEAGSLDDLIKEIVGDLDKQKAAQRLGDYDKDGLSDGAELDGMLGDNGRKYYSSPYTTDVDHDSDHDHVPDNVEMGEYDSVTGLYKVKSNPMNPNSVPKEYDIETAVYIIGWSYSKDEVSEFEEKWDSRFPDSDLTVNEDNDEWTDEMWEEFEKTNAFSRAAQTKKRELIDEGIDQDRIIVDRIDDNSSKDRSLELIWNEKWASYDSIMELHMFTHGDYGKPEVYKGTRGYLDDDEYKILAFNEYSKAYFYGCHTGKHEVNPVGEDIGARLQVFADKQRVLTYGSVLGSRFSSDMDKHVKINSKSENVYLNSYGIPWRDALEDIDLSTADGLINFATGYNAPPIMVKLFTESSYTQMEEFVPR